MPENEGRGSSTKRALQGQEDTLDSLVEASEIPEQLGYSPTTGSNAFAGLKEVFTHSSLRAYFPD
jgi:hypothetical protein